MNRIYQKLLDYVAVMIIVVAMVIVWVSTVKASTTDDLMCNLTKCDQPITKKFYEDVFNTVLTHLDKPVSNDPDEPNKPTYHFLVILGNQTIIQFTEKRACEDEADRLNKIITWRYQAVCVESR